METTDLFAVSLQGAAVEIDTPEVTKYWSLIRSFPKDAKQRACYKHLVKIMQATPDRPSATRQQLEEFCRKRFGVTVESFDPAWREANEATGAGWNRRGRRRR